MVALGWLDLFDPVDVSATTAVFANSDFCVYLTQGTIELRVEISG